MNWVFKIFTPFNYLLKNNISIWRTIYFNFHYLSFSNAFKFPILITRSVRFNKTLGKIILESQCIKPAMIRIGKKSYGFSRRSDHVIWEQFEGTVIFEGPVNIGKGTFVHIGEDAVLRIGQNTCFGGNDKIICDKAITIKKNTMAAWDVQIIDTDFRATFNTITKSWNCYKKEIIIGSNNWLCFGSTILKGTVTPDNCIVGSNSIINKDLSAYGENIVIGMESNVKVLAKYINWDSGFENAKNLSMAEADRI
jgi:acetyltransferase-like isoleucine patch superfamily enzyme